MKITTNYSINTTKGYPLAQPAFQGGYKSFNVLNPISYYADKYLAKSAAKTRQQFIPSLPELKGMYKQVKLGKCKISPSGWDINKGDSDKYVLFMHGMAQNVSNYQNLYKKILELNHGIFALEYRGYGANSSAKLSEDKLRNDVEKAFNYLTKEKGILPQNIIAIGHSMGGALAANLAKNHPDIKSLILISPISNAMNISDKFALNKRLGQGIPPKIKKLTNKIPILKTLYSMRFDSIDTIKEVKVPTYIIQSYDDTVATIKGCRQIYKNAKRNGIMKWFKVLPTGGHKVDEAKINTVGQILSTVG